MTRLAGGKKPFGNNNHGNINIAILFKVFQEKYIFRARPYMSYTHQVIKMFPRHYNSPSLVRKPFVMFT